MVDTSFNDEGPKGIASQSLRLDITLLVQEDGSWVWAICKKPCVSGGGNSIKEAMGCLATCLQSYWRADQNKNR
jgi:hypothetical protein